MKRLGDLLIEHGWITQDQLEAGLARTTQLGARLGTSLLEMGAITEELLLRTLSEQLEVPAADLEDLRHLEPELPSLLPAETAIRVEAIPFRQLGSRVDVAMLEVKNLALQDELSFVIGKRIRPHIANEARIFEALESYYGKECSFRFQHLLERLNRSRDRLRAQTVEAAEPEPAAEAATPPAAAPEPPAPATQSKAAEAPTPAARRPPPPRSIPLSAAERRALAGKPPLPEIDGHRPPWIELLESFRVQVDLAPEPAEIGQLLLDALSQEFVRVLLFRVGHQEAAGWLGQGPGLDRKRLLAYRIPLDKASPFQRVAADLGPVRGILDDSASTRRFLSLWNGSPGTEGLWWPIAIRNRLVCVAYADRDALGVEGVDLGFVLQLSARTGVALERCLLRRKLKRAKGLR